jgi:Tol biopolymer transport system component/DNA-binding winged helix-turn-helix (wHTH) protein
MLESHSQWIIEFDTFSVDLAAGDLKKRGRRVQVQELPFRLLATLLERPGQTVSREDLRARLWGDTVVDFDDGLHTAVRKLRNVLGDSTTHPRYIQTVPRRGYCFIAPISRRAPEPDAPTLPNSAEPAPRTSQAGDTVISLDAEPPSYTAVATAEEKPSETGRQEFATIAAPQMPPAAAINHVRIWTVAIAALLVISTVAAFEAVRRSTNSLALSQVMPLATDRGVLRSPSLSPDGRSVAFTWASENSDTSSIYVQAVDGSNRKRLTNDPASDFEPKWSPDGQSIAFIRNNELRLVAARGGPDRKLTPAVAYGLSWSPDSKMIAFCDRPPTAELNAVFVISVDSGVRRELTEHSSARFEDVSPAFSPDGKSVAFIRKLTTAMAIYVVSLAGGTPRLIAKPGLGISRVVWSPDGDHLVFSTGKSGVFSVPAGKGDSSKALRLDIAGPDVSQLSIVRRPDNGETELAFGHESSNWDIVASTIGEQTMPAKPLAASTRADYSPSFSPDSKRLVFTSARSGFDEIWTAASDGSHPVQLTHFNVGSAGCPSWSPDGQWIVFDATIDNNRDIYVISPDGGSVRRLTVESSAEAEPSWSHDGRWIYFMSDRLGTRQIWKMPSGGGTAVQVTRGGGYEALESPDGKTLFYAKQQTGEGVWSVPVNGGPEVLVSASAQHRLWSVADNGLYFFDLTGKMPQVFSTDLPVELKRLDFVTGQVGTVATIVTNLPSNLPAFGVTRDGKEVAWVRRRERSSEILLIRNVHF